MSGSAAAGGGAGAMPSRSLTQANSTRGQTSAPPTPVKQDRGRQPNVKNPNGTNLRSAKMTSRKRNQFETIRGHKTDPNSQAKGLWGPYNSDDNKSLICCWLCGFPIGNEINGFFPGTTKRTRHDPKHGDGWWGKGVGEHVAPAQYGFPLCGLYHDSYEITPDERQFLQKEMRWSHRYCNEIKSDLMFVTKPHGELLQIRNETIDWFVDQLWRGLVKKKNVYSYLKEQHGIDGGWIHLIHYWLDRMTRGNGSSWQDVVTQWKDHRKGFIKHCVNEFITDVNNHNDKNPTTLKTNYDKRKNMYPNHIIEREYQQLPSILTTSNNCYLIHNPEIEAGDMKRSIPQPADHVKAPELNDELTADEYNNTSNSEISDAENPLTRSKLFEGGGSGGDGGSGNGAGGGGGGESGGVQFTTTVYTKNGIPIPAGTVIFERPLFYSNGTEVPLGNLQGPKTIGGNRKRQTRRRKNHKRQTRKR
jgi:hypothetical protein